MPAPLTWVLAGLLTAGPLQSSAADPSQAPPAVSMAPGDRVVVVSDRGQTIRGRIADMTPDSVVLQSAGDRLVLPRATVQRIDRLGDSVLGGTAIGAAVGGGSTLALLAQVCSNSGCAFFDRPRRSGPMRHMDADGFECRSKIWWAHYSFVLELARSCTFGITPTEFFRRRITKPAMARFPQCQHHAELQ